MSQPDVDIVILGGGCAGLSVAVRLAQAGRALCVLEPRLIYQDDRTWCFWRTALDPFTDCVKSVWTNWSVNGPTGRVQRSSAKLRYECVGSGNFYQRAQSLLADYPAASLLLGRTATAVYKSPQGYKIETDAGILTANHVIDSRPPQRVPAYGQFFLGYEVYTNRPVFNPTCVQLMDFRAARSGGIDFVYTLPFSRHHALIEVTTFAPKTPPPQVLQAWLLEEIEALKPGGYEVRRQEAGALPMEVGYRAPLQPGVIAVGQGGGAVRPATGYAFARIQVQADALVAALQRGEMPRPFTDGPITRFMDSVFLQVMKSMPERGPAIFENLFRHTPPERLEHFLSGSSNALDRLAVMAAMPAMPFLKAALVSKC